jgi:hypothetical protein
MKVRTMAKVSTLAVCLMLLAGGAQAQATRTWVSGVGDDVNPCSRTAPCKTWAGAISKTAAGGEMNALDPGGFGTLTITKSIVVDGGSAFASTLNSGGINGIVINDSLSATPNAAKVVLRNLNINGAGSTPGLNGVRFLSGKELTLENVFITNQSSRGVDILRSTGAPLGIVNIINTTIQNVGAGAIVTNASGTPGPVKVMITNSRMMNSASGVFGGIGAEISISNSAMSHHSAAGVDGSSNSVINVDNCTIMNSATGVQTAGTSIVRLSRNVIVQNVTRGFNVAGGQIQSYGDNYFSGNGANSGVLTSISANKQ